MVNAIPDVTPVATPWISTVFGVDFSGAAKAGKTAWLAELEVASGAGALRLVDLKPLGKLSGDDSRESVCDYLVRRIRSSAQALWGMDFPFGLPIELELGNWPEQLRHVRAFPGTAKDFGRGLVELASASHGAMHLRRQTDQETKTPFDCYHYRIIYQTFHGMRDVLGPLMEDSELSVLPFQYENVDVATRVVVEACPSSTLKRLNLPHQRYKQPGGQPVDGPRKKNRRIILNGIRDLVQFSDHRRRVIMRDPGGDALDAVLAAVGSWHALQTQDHARLAAHARYPLEGFVFC